MSQMQSSLLMLGGGQTNDSKGDEGDAAQELTLLNGQTIFDFFRGDFPTAYVQ